jgi:hypothetical protein
VVDYTPGSGRIEQSARDPEVAVGPPDFSGNVDDGSFVSLGCNGVLTLQFTDNALIDVEGPDLYVFEVGPMVEAMSLEISEDGATWIDLGVISGGRAEVDLAGLVPAEASYRFVRLTDDGDGCGSRFAGMDRLQGMIEAPRQTRMPGLLVHGASGIGKTMIARNLSRKYAPEYDPASGITRTPLLLLQAPPAPDERRFYLHILAAVGAPATALSARAQNVASLEVRVIALLRDLGLRMIMIDEVHNLLAGTHREQRRFLNVLRYLSNELEVSLVCLGVSEAVDAIRGDIQLARRLDEHHLPNWRDDAEFSDMIQTLIAAMPLEKKSNLKVKSLKQVLALTGGVTSRIFALVKDLSIDAIITGEECITDDAIAKWTPVWSRHANPHRRLQKSRV